MYRCSKDGIQLHFHNKIFDFKKIHTYPYSDSLSGKEEEEIFLQSKDSRLEHV